jgi:hypothetical protein
MTKLKRNGIFKWRCADGRLLLPKEMETSHLYNTLLMIWNNKCEPKVGTYKKYTFKAPYTDLYLKQAVIFLGIELLDRLPQLTGEQKRNLLAIRGYSIIGKYEYPKRLK